MNYVDEEGRKGIRVQFYLQGLRKKATAQIDAREVQNLIFLPTKNIFRFCKSCGFLNISALAVKVVMALVVE